MGFFNESLEDIFSVAFWTMFSMSEEYLCSIYCKKYYKLIVSKFEKWLQLQDTDRGFDKIEGNGYVSFFDPDDTDHECGLFIEDSNRANNFCHGHFSAYFSSDFIDELKNEDTVNVV
jgi:hypothetical protein